MSNGRERWGTKLGVVLAVAGSAVGLGNFLRFPVQAAKYGEGAFLIPYLVALVLVGIPLVWIEWTAGRFGGAFGHSSAPGIFQSLRPANRSLKYFGIFGIFCRRVKDASDKFEKDRTISKTKTGGTRQAHPSQSQ